MIVLSRLASFILPPLLVAGMVLGLASPANATQWDYKKDFLHFLTDPVPDLLKTQDPKTGRFGTKPWIVTDQNVIYPLAAAWAIERSKYYHNPKVLDAVMRGGDALVDAQEPDGKWVFRKKDGSTWGNIYMPWTYSRWIRAYSLIRDAMPPEQRARWEKGLKLGFEGIAKEQMSQRLANIPCTQAMSLYLAGKLFDRSDWCAEATAYEHRVVDYQNPCGFWSEHSGPVVLYNTVYVDALGTYYAMSHDKYVLPALERAAKFHIAMTYPDGTMIATVDERNWHSNNILTPNVGFTFSPEGRGYLQHQLALKSRVTKVLMYADAAASFLLYGKEGPVKPIPDPKKTPVVVLSDHNAMTRRQGPWFTCLSAYHTTVSRSRWYQDRQNLVSLFHDKVGLILGGGNTKLQPLWSTFTVGDVSLLHPTPHDPHPDFIPPPGLVHVPNDAALDPANTRLLLQYELVKCQVKVDLSDPKTAKIMYLTEGPVPVPQVSGEGKPQEFAFGPVAAHVPFLATLGDPWTTGSGKHGELSKEPFKFTSAECGGWFQHHGWRVYFPPGATIQWPVLPHNQYAKDGSAPLRDGRIVVTLPFTKDLLQQEIRVQVP